MITDVNIFKILNVVQADKILLSVSPFFIIIFSINKHNNNNNEKCYTFFYKTTIIFLSLHIKYFKILLSVSPFFIIIFSISKYNNNNNEKCYTLFFIRQLSFSWASIFLTFPKIEPEVFLKFLNFYWKNWLKSVAFSLFILYIRICMPPLTFWIKLWRNIELCPTKTFNFGNWVLRFS